LTPTLVTLPTIEVAEPEVVEVDPGVLERYTISFNINKEVLIGE
jgi:hypothetical protein